MGVNHKQHHEHHDDLHRPFPTSVKVADTSSYTAANNISTKPSAMAAEVYGCPFTSEQWKELERQAMVYKYIRDSIPVPNHLLLPTSTPHSTAVDNGSIFNMNFELPKNGKDSEPGRCKRTDGKKWRCSRDVAPQHKYCERHLHRGRPRSRKPVEVQSNDNNNILSNKKSRYEPHILPSNRNIMPVGTPLYPFQSDVSVLSHREVSRSLDRAIQDQWHYTLGQGNIPYTNQSVFQQDFLQHTPNLIPFSNFGSLNFGDTQSQVENGLVDAWSSEDPHSNESSVFSQGNLSPSYLSLSMGMAASSDEMVNMQMGGLNMGEIDCENSHNSSLICPGSWMGSSTPGGPLAEALGGRNIS